MGEMTPLPVSLWSEASGEDMSFGFSLANSPLLNEVWSRCSVLREYLLVNDSPGKNKMECDIFSIHSSYQWFRYICDA